MENLSNIMYSNVIKCDCGAPVDLDQTDWCDACDKSIFAEPENKDMTPKEKAKELFLKFRMYLGANFMYDDDVDEDAKECALIAVDEILDAIVIINDYDFEPLNQYWKEVKQEIEKL